MAGRGPARSKRTGGRRPTARGAGFGDAALDRLLLAVAALELDGEVAEWWTALRRQHEAAGMRPEAARRVAYRQARLGELLAQDYGQLEAAERLGVSDRQIRTDIDALRRMLEPRLRLEAPHGQKVEAPRSTGERRAAA
jgi:hypothetical protein